MSWSRTVYSSMVSEVAYDDERQALRVTFVRGKTAEYAGVPEDKALELANAPSVGNYLNTEIKPYYQFRYV